MWSCRGGSYLRTPYCDPSPAVMESLGRKMSLEVAIFSSQRDRNNYLTPCILRSRLKSASASCRRAYDRS